MTTILQDGLPVAPWMADHTLRLPGTVPVALADWLQRDEAFAEQMAARDYLIAERPAAVHALADGARPAAAELLALVLAHLDGVAGYAREGGAMRRPDGILVPLDGEPLLVAGRLVQEDLVPPRTARGRGRARADRRDPVLSLELDARREARQAASSASTLPVERYDEGVARRVQRLFDAIRPEAPLMRANLLALQRPRAVQPAPRVRPSRAGPRRRRVRPRRAADAAAAAGDPGGGRSRSTPTWCAPRPSTPEQRAQARRGAPRRLRRRREREGLRPHRRRGLGRERPRHLPRRQGGHLGALRPDEARDAGGLRPRPGARCTPSTTCAGGTCSRRSRTPRMPRWPGSRPGWRRAAARLFLCTQNIDDLHERAGSRAVHHMHGELLKARCAPLRRGARRGATTSRRTRPARRAAGRGAMRPDVVWFGEMPLRPRRDRGGAGRGRPLRRHRHLGRGLPGGGLRRRGAGARASDARAQPRALGQRPRLRRGALRAGDRDGAGPGRGAAGGLSGHTV